MDRSRKRRRSRSEDLDTPRRPKSNALVPVDITRHAADESSDTSEDDDDRLDDDKLTLKRPRRLQGSLPRLITCLEGTIASWLKW